MCPNCNTKLVNGFKEIFVENDCNEAYPCKVCEKCGYETEVEA